MKITLLIGNGFDIAQGAKTKYTDFYEVYKNSTPVNDLEERMIDEIKGPEYNNWANLEEELGKFTAKATNPADFITFYYHMLEELHKYLKNEEENYSIDKLEKFINDLSFPERYLNNAEQSNIMNFLRIFNRESITLTVISYNYTSIFEKYIGYKDNNLPLKSRAGFVNSCVLDRIYKIHGTLDETPILGVNDASQISNIALGEDLDLQDILIKPQANNVLGSLVEENCKKSIRESTVILIHGLSLGTTDKMWWKEIGIRLQKNDTIRIIYFYYTTETVDSLHRHLIGQIKRRAKQEFFNACGINNDKRQDLENRVFVCVNSNFLVNDARNNH